MKKKIRNRIFELLKEIRKNMRCEKNICHTGLLIVYSDISSVLARGAYPIKKTIYENSEKDFDIIGTINDEKAGEKLKIVGEDGAVLIDKEGNIHSPSVYLNVNLFSVDPEVIEDDFCARHIAALATSASTKSYVFTLSEETGKVREFVSGKIYREYPELEKEEKEIAKEIEKELIREKIKDKIIKIKA